MLSQAHELYEQVYKKHYKLLYNIANRKLHKGMAEDVVQDTFLKYFILIKENKIGEICHIERLLATIATNTAINYYRHERTKEKYIRFFKSDNIIDGDIIINDIDKDIIKRIILESICQLSKIQAKVFTSIYIDDNTPRETSLIFRINIKDVYNSYDAAKLYIKRIVKERLQSKFNKNKKLLLEEGKLRHKKIRDNKTGVIYGTLTECARQNKITVYYVLQIIKNSKTMRFELL